jgi:hypothetical protein
LSEKPAGKTDQRNAVRLLCSLPITIRVLTDPAWQRLRVRVRDVTVVGIGLLSEVPVGVGAGIALDWTFGPPDDWKTLRARVVHLTSQGERFLIGCALDTPLDEADLKAILVWDGSRILPIDG